MRFPILVALLWCGFRAQAVAAPLVSELVAPAPAGDAVGVLHPSVVRADADGRFAVFLSRARNLVAGQSDEHGYNASIFVHDRQTGSSEMLSRQFGTTATACGQSNLLRGRSISADGRWISFSSGCNNLTANPDPNSGFNAFLHDRQSGTTRLLSQEAETGASIPASAVRDMSPDGRWILMSSWHPNIAPPGASDAEPALFVVDRDAPAGTFHKVADRVVLGGGNAQMISDDGRYVAFASNRAGLDATATYGSPGTVQVHVHDRVTGLTRLVSRIAGQNAASAASSNAQVVINGLGTVVSYVASSADITGANGLQQYDIVQDSNHASSPSPNHQFMVPMAASTDGDWLLYEASVSTRIVYLLQRSTGTHILVSHRWDNPGSPGNGHSYAVDLSSDGRHVMYGSAASNLVQGQVPWAYEDLFLFDRQSNTSSLLTAAAGDPLHGANQHSPAAGALSASGAVAYLVSKAGNLDATVADRNLQMDLYVRETASAQPAKLVTRRSAPLVAAIGNGSRAGPVSPDGRWQTFARATQTGIGQLGTGLPVSEAYIAQATYLRDRQTGQEWLVSRRAGEVDVAANGDSFPIAVSHDGQRVWFRSNALDLQAGFVRQGGPSVWLWERDSAQLTLLTPDPAFPNRNWPHLLVVRGLTLDGRWLLISSQPTPSSGTPGVYLFDRQLQTTLLVSHSAANPTQAGNGDSAALALSENGRWVLYSTQATDLQNGVIDTNVQTDLYLWDRLTNSSRLMSHVAGNPLRTANGTSAYGHLSADGAVVVFESTADNVDGLAADTNLGMDVFRYVLAQSGASLVSRAADAPARAANAPSTLLRAPDHGFLRHLDDDGVRLLFQTGASNIGPAVVDFNTAEDLYLAEWSGPQATLRLLTHRPGAPLVAETLVPPNIQAELGAGGDSVLLEASGSGVGSLRQVHVYDLPSGQMNQVSLAQTDLPLYPDVFSSYVGQAQGGRLVLFDSRASNLVVPPLAVDQNESVDGYQVALPPSEIFADGFEP